jgi:hypothetical protein
MTPQDMMLQCMTPKPAVPRRVQPIGGTLAVDAAGYCVNPCDRHLIEPPWLDLMVDWVVSCEMALGERAIALYLRGSVPRGQAIAGWSDLDGVVICRDGRQPTDRAWLQTLAHTLGDRHPCCRGIETSLITLADLWDVTQSWGALLKTQGLCVWGEDLVQALPPVALGPALLIHSPHLWTDWTDTAHRLRQGVTPARVQRLGAWWARRVVRSGFELVMLREGTYTRDLYPCYMKFARHYPAQSRWMGAALQGAIAPLPDRAAWLALGQTLVPWLTAELAHHWPNHCPAPDIQSG